MVSFCAWINLHISDKNNVDFLKKNEERKISLTSLIFDAPWKEKKEDKSIIRSVFLALSIRLVCNL